MNNRKIVILIIILAVLMGIFVIAKKDESGVKQNAEISRLSADYVKDPTWLTYIDERYPISFDYPPNGVVQVRAEGTEAEYNVIVGKRRGSNELEDTTLTEEMESNNNNYDSQYSVWFSLVSKTETPAHCIDPTNEGREYSTRNIGQSTIYEASGIIAGETYGQWSVVCIDIPDHVYFLSFITSDFSEGDFVQKVTDSIQFSEKRK